MTGRLPLPIGSSLGVSMSTNSEARSDFFREGSDARANGVALADNPYSVRTDEHAEWSAGWRATFDLDEEDDPASDRDHSKPEAVEESQGSPRPTRR